MALRDEIIRERKQYFAKSTMAEKVAYLFHYYGIQTLLLCIALFFFASFIYHYLTEPKCILNGTFVSFNSNSTSNNASKLAEDFLSSQNLDTSDYKVDFRTNITLYHPGESDEWQIEQALYTQISSGILDFAVGDLDIMNTYAYGYHFADLTTILSKEQIKIFEPYFLYVDLDVLIERSETHTDIPFSDFRQPENMKNPIPMMLDLSTSSLIQEIYGEKSNNICYGIIKKGENQKNAINFLEYLLSAGEE